MELSDVGLKIVTVGNHTSLLVTY